MLTRRALSSGTTGSLGLLGVAPPLAASERTNAPGKAVLRDAALRGLARTHDLGDPVLAVKADAALTHLERSDPEGAMLVRIYRAYDMPSTVWRYGKA